MTKNDLYAAVRSYLNRPGLPEAELNIMIASVEGVLNVSLRGHQRNLRRSTFVMAANQIMLPLPSDMMQILTLRIGDVTQVQYPAGSRDEAKAAGNSFVARGDCAEVFPTPTVTTEFALDYYGALLPLGSTTSTNWLLNYFFDVYLYGTLTEAAVMLKDNDRLGVWSMEFDSRLAKLIEQGIEQNTTTAPRVRLG